MCANAHEATACLAGTGSNRTVLAFANSEVTPLRSAKCCCAAHLCKHLRDTIFSCNPDGAQPAAGFARNLRCCWVRAARSSILQRPVDQDLRRLAASVPEPHCCKTLAQEPAAVLPDAGDDVDDGSLASSRHSLASRRRRSSSRGQAPSPRRLPGEADGDEVDEDEEVTRWDSVGNRTGACSS